MGFPTADYQKVIEEAITVVLDRCKKGRNEVVPWEQKFIHGPADVIYEIHERVCRIRGAEAIQDWPTMREDARDLVNEAAFLVLLIDRLTSRPDSPSSAESFVPGMTD